MAADPRVVRLRPADSEELVLVPVASAPGVPLLVQCCVAGSSLRQLQGARDRRAAARAVGTAPTDEATATNDDRSRFSCCSEQGVATVELAVVSGHADDPAPLAPPLGRASLDICSSTRSTPDWRRDPGAGAAASARELSFGLPADHGRAERPRHHRLGHDRAEDPAAGGYRPCRGALRALLACLPASASQEHARGRLLDRRDDLAAAALRALL